ncbi:class I SAM-dependent methyltransferase [Aequorivita sp. F47161]|uniref:Class I SAM-dependent methyltransferase n=1 Tax=Aequorivita vitellina TaxID=2874475 RepID=A0A9X1QVD6_9FLAO|nr:class I SAM-dependent methyltransferase [Aequorivita vitellina]MCG2420251.1 class I SAM-dependent methyltransferase [Aequorivita vitellina]
MTHTCRICNNSKENRTYNAREMMYGLRETFEYFQCSNCGCLQISEFPEDLAKYYPGNYYSFNSYDGKKFKGFKGAIKKKQYEAAALGGKVYKSTLGKVLGKKEYGIFKDLQITKETRLLDVGCGNGRNFLYPLAEVGFKNVMGCDPFLKETITYKNGLTIMKSSIYEIEATFDVITYHHAFEHLPDPFENLEKVNALLAPGGVCIIRIPTVSSFAWEHYGVDWVQLDAPRHFFLHSQKSMQILADKTNFELYKVEYDSTHFQFSGSEKYKKDIPLSAPKFKGFKKSLKRKVQNFKYEQKANSLNKAERGDQAVFYLRKK